MQNLFSRILGRRLQAQLRSANRVVAELDDGRRVEEPDRPHEADGVAARAAAAYQVDTVEAARRALLLAPTARASELGVLLGDHRRGNLQHATVYIKQKFHWTHNVWVMDLKE